MVNFAKMTHETHKYHLQRGSRLFLEHGGRTARINYSNLPRLVDCGRNSESEKKKRKQTIARKKWLFDISKITFIKHGIRNLLKE